ncbi:uncharacterized protein LOC141682581 [Apium graveolens]|uniref:uncharacterized protein LOC141682581 n=1 Tax=Apium graveolens TaxID=4045 RepID=UPI003D7BE3D5
MFAGIVKNGLKKSISGVYIHNTKSISDSIKSPIFKNELHRLNESRFFVTRSKKNMGFSLPGKLIVSRYCSTTSSSTKNGLVGWYLGLIKSRPILTKAVTSAIIYTAADFSSQALSPQTTKQYDLVRTLRMAGIGLICVGPSMHFWFNTVSKVLPKRDIATTLLKIVIGQTLFGPAMTAGFFSVNAGLQGENSTEIIARLKRDLVPTMISGVMYWPFCDFVTFKFVPVHLQPLVSNSFAYLWTVYLTYMASLEKADVW